MSADSKEGVCTVWAGCVGCTWFWGCCVVLGVHAGPCVCLGVAMADGRGFASELSVTAKVWTSPPKEIGKIYCEIPTPPQTVSSRQDCVLRSSPQVYYAKN